MQRVLILEPDAALRAALERAVMNAGFAVRALGSRSSLRDDDPCGYVAFLVDLSTRKDVDTIASLTGAAPAAAVIAMSSLDDHELAVGALHAGARDVLHRPFSIRILERALAASGPPRAHSALGSHGVGLDPGMQQLLREAETIARSDATVQVLGERGSGRRELARFLHAASPRRAAPLRVLECEAPDVLPQARECFGFVARGSATGAQPFGAGDGGTLVLAEPGALPDPMQERLVASWLGASSLAGAGGERRLLLVTSRPLRDEGRLRPVLRLRFDVLTLRVPPLRERPGDTARLALAFLERHALTAGVEPPYVGPRALAALCDYPWPGNVSELDRVMQRAVLLYAGQPLDVAGLFRGRRSAALPTAELLDLRELERRTVERSLALHRGNRTHAARALGISVRTLRNKIRDYGLRGDAAL